MDIGPDTSAADFARERMLAVYTRMPDNPAMIDMFGRYLNILANRDEDKEFEQSEVSSHLHHSQH